MIETVFCNLFLHLNNSELSIANVSICLFNKETIEMWIFILTTDIFSGFGVNALSVHRNAKFESSRKITGQSLFSSAINQ